MNALDDRTIKPLQERPVVLLGIGVQSHNGLNKRILSRCKD
jgi:hypothetical protein